MQRDTNTPEYKDKGAKRQAVSGRESVPSKLTARRYVISVLPDGLCVCVCMCACMCVQRVMRLLAPSRGLTDTKAGDQTTSAHITWPSILARLIARATAVTASYDSALAPLFGSLSGYVDSGYRCRNRLAKACLDNTDVRSQKYMDCGSVKNILSKNASPCGCRKRLLLQPDQPGQPRCDPVHSSET